MPKRELRFKIAKQNYVNTVATQLQYPRTFVLRLREATPTSTTTKACMVSW